MYLNTLPSERARDSCPRLKSLLICFPFTWSAPSVCITVLPLVLTQLIHGFFKHWPSIPNVGDDHKVALNRLEILYIPWSTRHYKIGYSTNMFSYPNKVKIMSSLKASSSMSFMKRGRIVSQALEGGYSLGFDLQREFTRQ